ncbi:MAG TPA: hypothetical protein VMB77_08640 [Syntrophales bacterium]|nr:hypothetical protein [Syntrophales bacterium]
MVAGSGTPDGSAVKLTNLQRESIRPTISFHVEVDNILSVFKAAGKGH